MTNYFVNITVQQKRFILDLPPMKDVVSIENDAPWLCYCAFVFQRARMVRARMVRARMVRARMVRASLRQRLRRSLIKLIGMQHKRNSNRKIHGQVL